VTGDTVTSPEQSPIATAVPIIVDQVRVSLPHHLFHRLLRTLKDDAKAPLEP
jgi:hypothetical protein